ncbi:MAG: hypothetical protein ACK5M7_04360 [Draconibacterium sp.]
MLKKIILVIFIAFVAGSCDKDEAVNMNLLQEFKFVFAAYRDYQNNDLTIDEFIYSFDDDSMTVSGNRYEFVDNVKTPAGIVTIRWPYFVEGNKIIFPPLMAYENLISEPELISPVPYRQLQWKVLLLNETQMSVDIIGNSTLAGHAEFRIEK